MSRRREQLASGQHEVIVFENYISSHNHAMLRIDVQSEARLHELRTIAKRLSTGESKMVRLSELRDAHWVSPLLDVVLMVATQNPDTPMRSRDGQLVCEWVESTEGWLESAEKIAGMQTFGKPCHQYFEGPHADSLTIELAYLE